MMVTTSVPEFRSDDGQLISSSETAKLLEGLENPTPSRDETPPRRPFRRMADRVLDTLSARAESMAVRDIAEEVAAELETEGVKKEELHPERVASEVWYEVRDLVREGRVELARREDGDRTVRLPTDPTAPICACCRSQCEPAYADDPRWDYVVPGKFHLSVLCDACYEPLLRAFEESPDELADLAPASGGRGDA